MVDDPCPPALIIKAESCGSCSQRSPGNYDSLVTDGGIFAVCPPEEERIKEPRSQTTPGGTSTLHWAAMQSFIWKRLCQASVLFLEAIVGRAGLWLDMEYRAANRREPQENRGGRFLLEPDWLDRILIPASSDNGSKNGVEQQLLWTLTVFFVFLFIFFAHKRATDAPWHDVQALKIRDGASYSQIHTVPVCVAKLCVCKTM